MEVELPSGFTANKPKLNNLMYLMNIKKIETKRRDTVVVIYFDSIGTQQICPTIDAIRSHKVAFQKPVSVYVYDFYDTSRAAQAFYKVKPLTVCEICEPDECDKSCAAEAIKSLMFKQFMFNYVKYLTREYL